MKKRILLAGILAAAVVFAVTRRPARPAFTPAPAGAEDTAQSVERFTLEGFEPGGGRSWELQGEHARLTGGANVFIEKNVVLKIRGSTVVTTDKVYWDGSKQSFLTRLPVRIEHEGHVIEGIGALGKISEEFLQINRDVRLELRDSIVLTALGPFKIFHKTNRAVFYRDVCVVDKKGTVRAEELEVLFDSKTGQATRLIARKNVRIARGGDLSRSEAAVYDTRTQSVRLVGSPEILFHEDSMESLEKAKGPDGAS